VEDLIRAKSPSVVKDEKHRSEEIETSTLFNRQISKVVPLRGLVSFVDRNGAFKKNVPLRSVLRHVDESVEKLIIASMVQKNLPDQDPHVVCKIQPLRLEGRRSSSIVRDTPAARDASVARKVSGSLSAPVSTNSTRTNKISGETAHSSEDGLSSARQLVKRRKPPTTKSILISWNIAPKDLNDQKAVALRSVLSKGDTLKVELCIKDKHKRPKHLSSLDLEKRELLIEQCKDMCSQWGDLYGRIEGRTTDMIVMIFKPKKELI
jgi:hypothetical protein